jgi:succinoglycan biosynthesis protein ExoW
MVDIAVVIPFFQRRIGILARALESVRQQDAADMHIHVVVVDDESPVTADADIAAVIMPSNISLTHWRQPNRGPGGARNGALDSLATESPEFVAFLDSDDVWEASHLRRAITILGDKADFYGADHTRLGAAEGTTYLAKNSLSINTLDQLASKKAVAGHFVYWLKQAAACEAFILNYLVQTSTVVYRWSSLKTIRFDPVLRMAGEDNMFWIESASRSRSVAIDTALGARCLDGVNIYESATSWDDSANVRRIAYLLILWTKAKQRFYDEERLTKVLKARVANFERAFSFMWLRSVLRRQGLHRDTLHLLRQVDRRLPVRLARASASTLWHYAFTRHIDFIEH